MIDSNVFLLGSTTILPSIAFFGSVLLLLASLVATLFLFCDHVRRIIRKLPGRTGFAVLAAAGSLLGGGTALMVTALFLLPSY